MTEPRPILLVEDSPDDVEFALLALREAGIDAPVDVAGDGEAAVAYLARTRPRLVILDLKIPKLGGFDVLARIRADDRTRHVPVVIFSSSDVPEDVVRAYDLGANSYVRKPVEFDRYADAVGRVGRYWLEVNYGV